ncbi:MAG: bile acid:sodium symporter family protein [Thermoguttaceae bacterium]
MFQRLLILWLTLLGLAAFCWERWLPGVFDPFVATKPLLNYLFAATMLAIGATLPREEIRQVAMHWPTVLGGTAVQFTAMPLLGWVLPILFGLDHDATIGVVIVGCAPDAMASSVLTLMARGNVSYSVSLTIMSTVLSPLVVPAVMLAALGQHVDFPTGRAAWELCWMVVLPVVAGHVLSRASVRWETLARRAGPIVADATILWIIAVVVALNRQRLVAIELRLLGALLAMILLGCAAGWVGGLAMRLSVPMRRALVLGVGMQNAGLGTVLALDLFHDRPATAIPPAIYTFGSMFIGTLMARAWTEYDDYRARARSAGSASAASPEG